MIDDRFLEAVQIARRDNRVNVATLAREMDVSPMTAMDLVEKLQAARLVDAEGFRIVVEKPRRES